MWHLAQSYRDPRINPKSLIRIFCQLSRGLKWIMQSASIYSKSNNITVTCTQKTPSNRWSLATTICTTICTSPTWRIRSIVSVNRMWLKWIVPTWFWKTCQLVSNLKSLRYKFEMWINPIMSATCSAIISKWGLTRGTIQLIRVRAWLILCSGMIKPIENIKKERNWAMWVI